MSALFDECRVPGCGERTIPGPRFCAAHNGEWIRSPEFRRAGSRRLGMERARARFIERIAKEKGEP